MPKKNSKNAPLNEEEKENNRVISSLRMTSEHAICGLKRYNCLSVPYRNKKGQDDDFVYVCAGLWNYHLSKIA